MPRKRYRICRFPLRIGEVYRDRTIFKDPPHKFEAGTPHIAGVIGLGAAVDYLTTLGMENVRTYEKAIVTYALSRMNGISGITLYGPMKGDERGSVLSFTVEGVHPHDVAQILDGFGICVRAGNHSPMPLHTYLGIAASVRASLSVYNTREDIDALVEGLREVKRLLL